LESLLENARFLKAEVMNSLCIKEEKMKRFWLVLLSLGLIMAFSASAFAVDVKVSGNFEVGGLYLNKISVDDAIPGGDPSTGFFYQKLRFGADFIVAPCLKLVTQFDALDRIWGGARSAPAGGFPGNGGDFVAGSMATAGTRAESENIAMRLGYIEYTSPVGLFRLGYQTDYDWGTVFAGRRAGTPAGAISYMVPAGPVVIVAQWAKEADLSYSAVFPNTVTDNDFDSFRVGAIFNFNTSQAKGEAGALLLYGRDATNRAIPGGWITNQYSLLPYFKATVGPVFIQGEIQYSFGDAAKFEKPAPPSNLSINAWSVFLDATINLGQLYVGGSFAYLEGPDSDPSSTTVKSGPGLNSGGLDWNPCLIMFNTYDTAYWVGMISGDTGSQVNNEMMNAWFFQGRVGVKPMPQLDVQLALSYASADQKPTGYSNGTYGTEVDLTGTYKITNNLSYMLGVGYLFTGDYFQGAAPNSTNVDNDYLIINKLTLSF
jgi:hypothetical protein